MGMVTYPNGTVEVKPECTSTIPKASLARLHRLHAPAKNGSGGPIDPNSNNLYPASLWLSLNDGSAQVDHFSASYSVPGYPASGNGGSWWLGTENTGSGELTVLQPVLYFDHGKWNIVSENCCPGKHDFRQGDVSVSQGDTIEGVVQRTSGTSYSITTSANGKSYTLNADNGSPMNSPLIALEMYGDSYECSDLPQSPGVTATNVKISPAANWPDPQKADDDSDVVKKCGWTVKASGGTAAASPPTSDRMSFTLV